MQEVNGLDCAGQGCMNTAGDPAERAVRQVEAFLLGRCWQVQQLAHATHPAELIRPIKAHEVSCGERLLRLRIGQPVNHRAVGAGPCRFSPAQQRHKAVADQALKLGGSPLLIGDDPPSSRKMFSNRTTLLLLSPNDVLPRTALVVSIRVALQTNSRELLFGSRCRAMSFSPDLSASDSEALTKQYESTDQGTHSTEKEALGCAGAPISLIRIPKSQVTCALDNRAPSR